MTGGAVTADAHVIRPGVWQEFTVSDTVTGWITHPVERLLRSDYYGNFRMSSTDRIVLARLHRGDWWLVAHRPGIEKSGRARGPFSSFEAAAGNWLLEG